MKIWGRKTKAGEGDGPPVTAEAVAWAYRLFLGREPENDRVVQAKVEGLADLGALRREFLESSEFRRANRGANPPVLNGTEPAMAIDDRPSPDELAALFEHIQRAWQSLGETEPYYSVLTAERFETAKIDANLAEFHATGRRNAETFLATLRRNGIDPAGLHTCLEYGCGVGRVTRWLADSFARVLGFDISRAHLDLARSYLDSEGIGNVELHHVERIGQLKELPRVDALFSVIVLQHNPPPVIAVMIGAFLEALRPGGVAYFQVPTYRKDYAFDLKRYLSGTGGKTGIEMHVLPQGRVFEIVHDCGGRVLEVLEDNWTGARDIEVSNTFVVRKLGA